MDFAGAVLLGISFFLILIFFLMDSNIYYWKQKGIPNVLGWPLIGNLKDVYLMKKSLMENFDDIYKSDSCKNSPIIGFHIFHKHVLMIKDLELVKRILIKNFQSFSDRHTSGDPVSDPIGGFNLVLLRNPIWKKLRTKLTPYFSAATTRQIFGLMLKIGENLNSLLISKVDEHGYIILDANKISSQYTTDVIGSCVFGVEANSLHNPKGEFYKIGMRIFNFTWFRGIEFSSFAFIPELVPYLRLKFFSKEANTFLRSSINHVISEREKSGQKRNDLIDILINMKREDQAKDSQYGEIVMTGDVLVAQAAIFFAAGYETSSTTIAFALRLLAREMDKQKKLRNEIRNFLMENDGILTYDNINKLEYLNMVILETLRLYPPLPFLDRICTAKDGFSLSPFNNFVIPKGMPVYIPIYSIHHDPQYYYNPEKFEPERFSSGNKTYITSCSWLPFGTGPHACIGERFGMLQTKVGLLNILKDFIVSPTEGTPPEIKLNKKSLLLQQEGDIYLKFKQDSLNK